MCASFGSTTSSLCESCSSTYSSPPNVPIPIGAEDESWKKPTRVETPLAGLIRKSAETGVKMELARKAYAHMLAAGGDAEKAFADLGIKVVADEGELLELVRKAIAANPQAVADYKAGKTKAADRIKGFVMRETKGQAPPERLQQLLEQELTRG